MKKLFFAGLLCITFTASASDDIQQLKEELKKQQEIINQLQEKVRELQKQNDIKEETKQKLNKLHQSPIDKLLSNPFSQAKFVPDISLILDFSYVGRNLTDDTYKTVNIPGFNHGLFHHDGEIPYNAEKGFNFNYGELYISHAVDPYFDLVGIFHLGEGSFEIEEGYFRTRSLPFNLQLKGGKFYSKFGRLNEQHPHFWDFVDAPLIYRAVFGEHNLLEKGAQLTWLAPTPFYLMFGVEVFQGDNENNFDRNGFSVPNTNPINTTPTDYFKVADTKKPNLYTFFVKPSFDIGKLSILGGFTYAEGKTRIDHLEDEDPHAVAGKTRIYGLDLTARYSIDSYRYITWQSEYIHRNFDGVRYGYDNSNNLITPSLNRKQAGFYSQLIYKFDRRWRVGARYDLISKNDVFVNNVNENLPDNLYKYSFMVDFLPSEFSRIRLQYNYDRSLFLDGERKPNNEIILQFNMAIGAHGTHGF